MNINDIGLRIMNKTHAEFFEELKKYVTDCVEDTKNCDGYVEGFHDACVDILNKIEQFQAEANNENK